MKFLIFSDLHLHKFSYSNITSNGANELLLAGLNIIDQVCNYAIDHKIQNIFFLGDLFHSRNKIDSEVYSNLVYAKLCFYFDSKSSMNLIMVPGNHDQINKEGQHLLLPFSKISNITVIDDFYKTSNNFIICPHQYNNEKLYSFLQKNSDDNSIIFMHQLLVNSPTMSGGIFRKNEAVDISKFKYKFLFSGHNHKNFENKELKVYNVGSPMHYDFGDAECQERFFIHYEDGQITWIPTTFPHFAMANSKDVEDAQYVKKQSKKVIELASRLQIEWNDETKSILKSYIASTQVIMTKDTLLDKGLSLLTLNN